MAGIIADSAAKASGRRSETRRDEPSVHENVSEHRRIPCSKWQMEFPDSCVESRLQTRSNYATARNYWISPPHRAEPPVPVIRHFEFHSGGIGNPRDFPPLASESFEWSRLIDSRCIDTDSRDRFYEAKIDREEIKKSIYWFILSTHCGIKIYENPRFHRFFRSISIPPCLNFQLINNNW